MELKKAGKSFREIAAYFRQERRLRVSAVYLWKLWQEGTNEG